MTGDGRPTRLVIGMTGSAPPAHGLRLLEVLRDSPVESHLVVSPTAREALRRREGLDRQDLRDLADHLYDERNQAARISSGSYLTEGMIIAPCGMTTVAAIAGGIADNLIRRTADVTLKEGRQLVVLLQESPLSPIQVDALRRTARAGVIVATTQTEDPPGEAGEPVDRTARRLLGYFEALRPLLPTTPPPPGPDVDDGSGTLLG